jgi:hypothetical protein
MKVVIARRFSNSALGSLELQDAPATGRSRNLGAVYGNEPHPFEWTRDEPIRQPRKCGERRRLAA